MLWWLSNQLNFLLYRSDSGKHISMMWRHREDNFSQFYPYHENINRLYVFHFDGDERNIGDFCVFYPRSRVKESIWRTPWSKYRTKKRNWPFYPGFVLGYFAFLRYFSERKNKSLLYQLSLLCFVWVSKHKDLSSTLPCSQLGFSVH